jgi:cation-transporting ATPase E
MASGSDAAKNVAHLVSLDSSFSSLPDVVREGRRVINNLQRTVSVFLIKTVFAAVLTFLFLVGAFKISPQYPFDLANMYLWEILCIGIGSLFLSLQPNDEQIKSKFLMNVIFRIIPASTVQIGLVIFFFLYCKDVTAAQTLSVLAFSIFSYVIFVRVCLPFYVYRVFLVVGLTFVGVIATIADIFAKQIDFFGMDYSIFKNNSKYGIALCLALVVALIVYAGLSVVASKVHKYIDKKREERRYDHF